MANIFAILTAVLLAASTYLAFKNKEKYGEEIEARQEAEKYLDSSQKRLKTNQDNRDATIAERKGVEQETVAKREEEESAKSKNDAMRGDIDGKRAESAANKTKIEEFEDKTKELGEIKELAGKIKRMKEDINGLEDEKMSKGAMLANLRGEKASTGSTITQYNNENTAVSSQKSFFPSARITAIYGPWGFVTLSAGNSAGAVAGSNLDVVRGDEVIAKLRVRSVEATRASADVIPESVGEDVTLMVGDKVVPTSDAGTAAAAATDAAE